jgi:hypothetical protein
VRHNNPKFFSLAEQQLTVCGTAKGMSLLQNRFEHRDEVAGRRIDYP